MDARAVRRRELAARDAPQEVSFADALPLLITCEASLAELNGRTPRAFGMDRFRPNLVVAGSEPFEEDSWARLAIGDVELDVVQPCGRCVMVTIDPRTAEAAPDQEPLRTLHTYRKVTAGPSAGNVAFGWYAAGATLGELEVGAEVRVLERRS